jgi:uncharacterized protein (DUF1697 family)
VVADRKTKLYVSFLYRLPERQVRLPLINEKEGLEVIRMEGEEAFVISREVNGRYGFPNNFIEKELSVLATTRNWNTITRMINPKENA